MDRGPSTASFLFEGGAVGHCAPCDQAAEESDVEDMLGKLPKEKLCFV